MRKLVAATDLPTASGSTGNHQFKNNKNNTTGLQQDIKSAGFNLKQHGSNGVMLSSNTSSNIHEMKPDILMNIGAPSSTKSIPSNVVKLSSGISNSSYKKQMMNIQFAIAGGLGSGRRMPYASDEGMDLGSGKKIEKQSAQDDLRTHGAFSVTAPSGALNLKFTKKQLIHAPQKAPQSNNNHVQVQPTMQMLPKNQSKKVSQTEGVATKTIPRDLSQTSTSSDKLNSSLGKLKSRNRCNECLEVDGKGHPTSGPGQSFNSCKHSQQQTSKVSQPGARTVAATAGIRMERSISKEDFNKAQDLQILETANGNSIQQLGTITQVLSAPGFSTNAFVNHFQLQHQQYQMQQSNSLERQPQISGKTQNIQQKKKKTTLEIDNKRVSDREKLLVLKNFKQASQIAHAGQMKPTNAHHTPLMNNKDIAKEGVSQSLEREKLNPIVVVEKGKKNVETAFSMSPDQKSISKKIDGTAPLNIAVVSRVKQSSGSNIKKLSKAQVVQKDQSGQKLRSSVPIVESDISLQTERILPAKQLSVWQDQLGSAREHELSTTINCTKTTGGLGAISTENFQGNVKSYQQRKEDNGNQRAGEGSGHSEFSPINNHNLTSASINFTQNNNIKQSQKTVLKREINFGATSNIFGNSLLEQSKPQHYKIKTGSCNQRITTEDGNHSSPSGGGRTNGTQSCNKSLVQFGLSSQSFMTNSNSNGGSNPRQTVNNQNESGVAAGMTGFNSSLNGGQSFIKHKRQSSGGQIFANTIANLQMAYQFQASNKKDLVQLASIQDFSSQVRKTMQMKACDEILSASTTLMEKSQVTKDQILLAPRGGATMQKHIGPNDIKPSNKPHTLSGGRSLPGTSVNSSRSNSIKKYREKPSTGQQLVNNFIERESDGKKNIKKPKDETVGKYGGPPVSMRMSILQSNRQQYNHTVEEEQKDSLLIRSVVVQSVDSSKLNKSNHENKKTLQIMNSSSKKRTTNLTSHSKGHVNFEGLNKSVIVEATPTIETIFGPHKKQQNLELVASIKEFEFMKQELKSKDLMIQNLRDRLLNLEEKVNGIQTQQQRLETEEDGLQNTESERQRDKSQQRIKEAIINLEKQLEQFRLEKELNNLRLEELKQYSSSQHSSSRQSEQILHSSSGAPGGNKGGFIGNHLPFMAQNWQSRAHNYIPTSSSGGGGYATNSLGIPKQVKKRSKKSLIEDLESLITIAENQESQQNLLDVAVLPGHYPITFFEEDNHGKPGRYLTSAKTKTPMFEDDIAKLAEENEEDDDDDDQGLILDQVVAGNMIIGDGEGEEDNSCLIMLEKEWQEAQRQKEKEVPVDKNSAGFILGGSGRPFQNKSNLFDQSLISSSQLHNNQKNNQTQNNIVFFFDEDGLGQDSEAFLDDEIELAVAKGEKFIKTQKIEFGGRQDLAANNQVSSLSPTSNLKRVPDLKVKRDNLVQEEIKSTDQATAKTIVASGSGGFSRTLSKTTLIAKIRNAIGKQDQTQGGQTGQPSQNKIGGGGIGGKQKNQRRFIVKRSQERPEQLGNAQSSLVLNRQDLKSGNINFNNPPPPLKLKSKVIAATSTTKQLPTQQPHSGGDQIMKTIVQQKEKLASTQKDPLKQERELSLKLRQAITKLNLKIQIQQTQNQGSSVMKASKGVSKK